MGKAVSFLRNINEHWHTPPNGYQVPYKEFTLFSAGSGSVSLISLMISWATLGMTIPMIISYFKVPSGMIFFLGIAASAIALVRAPVLSMIIDNSNSKKGKFKPFLIPSLIIAGASICAIPFIPSSWVEHTLFSVSTPEMPLFKVEASTVSLSVGVLAMFLLLQTGTTFCVLLSQALCGIEQTITTVAQERANIASLKGILCNLPGSIVNIVMPLAAGLLFAVGTTTGMNNIKIYRIFFPICFALAVAFICLIYFGTHERVVVNQTYKNRVSFFEGAKELSKNKYFWILTIFQVAVSIRVLAYIANWVCLYAIGGKEGDTAIAICNIILGNAYLPGMVFGPLLVKKFGKKKTLIAGNIGLTFMVALQLILIRNPYLALAGLFFQNMFRGVEFFSSIMISDVLDYQQWKTGRRLEGFWQNYSNFILTLAGVFTSVLTPLFLSFAGIGFGDNIDTALQNAVLRDGALQNITILGLIGSVLAVIPICFYDLTEKKHADFIRVLKIRAAARNFMDGCLLDADIENVKAVMDYTESENDAFLAEEIEKHAVLSEIRSMSCAARDA